MSPPDSLLPEDWQELTPLVDRLLDAPPGLRASLLTQFSAGDPALRAELARLVAECERELPLLDRPAVERFDQLRGAESAPPLPEVLGGRYRIEREVGSGGMALVYLAQDLKHARQVAIKVIRPELAASLGRDRFLREIAIAARLRHPNIMPLYDSGDADGVLYSVMPYEEGLSLRARLERESGLPVADAISILRDVARALAYAHEHGIVHRDVKPDNVMLAGDAAIVTDFGIAKAFSAALTETGGNTITQVGSVIGTPAYMAPEQATGDPATDHRADIYSFGCLAYEVFVGKPPFVGVSTHQVIAAHFGTAAKPVTEVRGDVPSSVAALIERCLEKDPAARPQSANELLDALGSVATVDPSPIPRLRVSARSATLLAAALVVVAIAGYLIMPRRTPVTVAVLPLLSVGGDSNQVLLAAGFSDDIATALNRVPWVKVMSQGGAGNYRGQRDLDLRQTGRALGANYLVTGSVRSLDGKFTVQLISSEDGSTLWAEGFDRPALLEALRDRIVKTIGDSLRSKAGGSWPPPAAAASGTHRSSDAAYRLYVMGKEQLNRRKQSVGQSLDFFREAIALDSLSAEPYSGLSLALALIPRLQQLSAAPFIAEATAAARRALLLNPRLSEPHVALGMLLEYGLEWDRAESEYKEALELDSHDVEARVQYAVQLRLRGRLAESMKLLQAARQDDPGSAVVASHLSNAWLQLGQLDSALAESARARKIDDSNLTTVTTGALVMLAAGRAQEARQLILRLPPSNPLALYVLGVAGDRATVLERLQAIENTRPPSPRVHVARAYAMFGLGDTARAMEALERATDAKEPWFWGSGGPRGPILSAVRRSPRFAALLTRVGLSQ